MVDIKQQIRNILDEIIELDKLKAQKLIEIKKLYNTCDHKFTKIFEGHKVNHYICDTCGYEESRERYSKK